MSLIVPWTDPGGPSCCCTNCNEAQSSNYSKVQISSGALSSLFAGGSIRYDAEISVDIGRSGSFGSFVNQSGLFGVQANWNSAGGCAAISTLNGATISVDTIACSSQTPVNGESWTLVSESCFTSVGAVGAFAHGINGSEAYIQAGATLLGAFSRRWVSEENEVFLQGTFTLSFVTSASTSNGTATLNINGQSFLLPVFYTTNIASDYGTVSWANLTITFTPAAP